MASWRSRFPRPALLRAPSIGVPQCAERTPASTDRILQAIWSKRKPGDRSICIPFRKWESSGLTPASTWRCGRVLTRCSYASRSFEAVTRRLTGGATALRRMQQRRRMPKPIARVGSVPEGLNLSPVVTPWGRTGTAAGREAPCPRRRRTFRIPRQSTCRPRTPRHARRSAPCRTPPA